MRELSDRVRIIAVHHYTDQSQEVFSQQTGVNRALPFLLLSDSLESLVKKLDKAYAEPILGSVFCPYTLYVRLTVVRRQPARYRLALCGDANSAIPH